MWVIEMFSYLKGVRICEIIRRFIHFLLFTLVVISYSFFEISLVFEMTCIDFDKSICRKIT